MVGKEMPVGVIWGKEDKWILVETARRLLEIMQHPCRGCSQTFSDPCLILICAPLYVA